MRALICLVLFLQLPAFADSLNKELTSEILELARRSEGKPDLDGKLQAALELKVQDLEKVLPNETSAEKAKKILGPWRQVFGPYSPTGDGKIPFGTRTDHIYQIIYPQGLFYNVALFEKAGVKFAFLLKGRYEVTAEAIEGTFVRNSIVRKNLDLGRLHKLPAQLEDGSIGALHLPRQIPPVGQGGKLFEVYADRRIRILRGVTPQFQRPALYIMERILE